MKATEYLKDVIEKEYGIRPLTRDENGDVICYCCGRVAKEHCYSKAGLRETEISVCVKNVGIKCLKRKMNNELRCKCNCS